MNAYDSSALSTNETMIDDDSTSDELVESKPPPKRSRIEKRTLFPVKLHSLISNASNDSDVALTIQWGIHGRSFEVSRVKLFEKNVLPKYFKITKMKSFVRQLNLYNFTRITAGRDQGSYYHVDFLRGHYMRSALIRRVKGNGVVKEMIPQTAICTHEHDPNFHLMPPIDGLWDDAFYYPNQHFDGNMTMGSRGFHHLYDAKCHRSVHDLASRESFTKSGTYFKENVPPSLRRMERAMQHTRGGDDQTGPSNEEMLAQSWYLPTSQHVAPGLYHTIPHPPAHYPMYPGALMTSSYHQQGMTTHPYLPPYPKSMYPPYHPPYDLPEKKVINEPAYVSDQSSVNTTGVHQSDFEIGNEMERGHKRSNLPRMISNEKEEMRSKSSYHNRSSSTEKKDTQRIRLMSPVVTERNCTIVDHDDFSSLAATHQSRRNQSSFLDGLSSFLEDSRYIIADDVKTFS